MEFPGFDPNTKLAAVYYTGGKQPHLFKIHNDVTLSRLKDELDPINRQLNHRDTMRVVGVEYRCPLSNSSRSLRFNRMKLTNDELDASLVRSAEQILKSLNWPMNYEEIRALLEGPPDEEISLGDPW